MTRIASLPTTVHDVAARDLGLDGEEVLCGTQGFQTRGTRHHVTALLKPARSHPSGEAKSKSVFFEQRKGAKKRCRESVKRHKTVKGEKNTKTAKLPKGDGEVRYEIRLLVTN